MNCEHENCDLPPKYGKINHSTGRFEKKHCKVHKQEGEKGRAPPWSKGYQNFVTILKLVSFILNISKEEWKEGTLMHGKNFKPKMICPVGHDVKDTSIHSFVNHGRRCPTCAMKRSQKLMTEIVEKLYPNNKFQCDFRPSFLKYNKGNNLELDMYCEELKLAFEYDGRQHRMYVERFHKTEQVFIEQQERDVWKDAKCKELGITLIRIPDKDGDICIDCYNPENMERYIKVHHHVHSNLLQEFF